MIRFYSEVKGWRLTQPTVVRSWLVCVLAQYEQKAGDINFIFVDDEQLLELNRKHLNHDYYTDILTFDLGVEKGKRNADLYLSIDRIQDNAMQLSVPFEQELHRVMVHGILHLCGLTDETDAAEANMRLAEDAALSHLPLLSTVT